MQPLLMVKRLFMEASSYADRGDPVSSGIAISMLQDSADLYLRTLIKDRKLQMNANFPTNIATLRNNKISMPYAAKLEELNTARVNFKHYLNLPAVDEAKKHQTYVEDFLRSAMLDHFQISFDELSLADLVTDPEIKAHLKAAEENVETGSFTEAAKDLAKAKTALFSKLENYIPKVDVKLRQVDRAINSIDSVGHANPVTYLTHYLNLLEPPG